MKILLVDSDRCEGAVLAGEFQQRGHDVVRCFPEAEASVCVGAREPERCPVDSLGCDVAVLVREPSSSPRLSDMGAVCAIRRHIPVVEAYGQASSPFSQWATPTGTAVVEAVEEFDAGLRPRLVQAVEEALQSLPVVTRLGRVPRVAVRAHDGRVSLTIELPDEISPVEEDAIVTWAVRAIREQDPFSATTDVMVTGRASRH